MIKFKSLNQSKKFLKILKKKKLNNKYFTIYFDKNTEKDLNKYLVYISEVFYFQKNPHV